jgi:hypothetical protein
MVALYKQVKGSMGIKTGRRRRYSKLYRIKGFAKNMVSSLDNGDFAGLVTFGERANVLLPMTEITTNSRVCLILLCYREVNNIQHIKFCTCVEKLQLHLTIFIH